MAGEITKRIDAEWAAGQDAGGLGVPDLTASIVLVFDEVASPETITASSGAPWAACSLQANETGTIVINGGSTNNGIFEVTACTPTELQLSGEALAGDETGGSGEYEARYILPNTWYHFFLIELAGTEDAGFDTSETAVNLLAASGYDQYRFLRSVFLGDTANILPF